MTTNEYMMKLAKRVSFLEKILDEMRPFFPATKKTIKTAIKCQCCSRPMPPDWFIYLAINGNKTNSPICGECVRTHYNVDGWTITGPLKQGAVMPNE